MPTYSIVLSLMGAALLTMTACGGRAASETPSELHSAHTDPAAVALREDLAEKRADPVMGTAAGWTVRLDLDGYFPDEDILVATTSPDFWQQGAGAFITKPPYLNGKARQDYHRVYIRPTGEDWTEQMVTVVPDADGKLTITCYAVAPGAMNIVHWDDLRVEGATLTNGSFEQVAEDGTPVGWDLRGWGDDAPRGELIHDPDDAAEGERYVTASWTWHWNATITDVVAERPIVLRWKSRFVPPETSYPVRVGISGLDAEPAHEHVTFSTPPTGATSAPRPRTATSGACSIDSPRTNSSDATARIAVPSAGPSRSTSPRPVPTGSNAPSSSRPRPMASSSSRCTAHASGIGTPAYTARCSLTMRTSRSQVPRSSIPA